MLSNISVPIPYNLVADSARGRLFVLGISSVKVQSFALSAPHQLVYEWQAPGAVTMDMAPDGSVWTGKDDGSTTYFTRWNASTGENFDGFFVADSLQVCASLVGGAGPGSAHLSCLQCPASC